MKARLSLFSEDEKTRIHDASLQVLANIGIKSDSTKVLDILKDSGANVNYDSKIAFIPRNLVEEALKVMPKTVVYGARNPKYDYVLDKKRSHPTPCGFDIPYITDWETGQRRPSTNEDLARLTRLADYLDNYDEVWTSLASGDLPVPIQGISSFVTALRNTEKHITYQAANAEEAKFMIEVAATIVGGRKELKKRPLFGVEVSVVSPLRLDVGPVEAALEFGAAGIPVLVVGMPVSGTTAPATVAGTMLLANAEWLAEMTVLQLANPGAPVVYAHIPCTANYATGALIQSPEGLLYKVGVADMAHNYYDVPCMGYGGNTSAKLLDAQAGSEKAQSFMAFMLMASDVLSGAGELDDALCMCPEALVIDNEMIGEVFKFVEKYEINDDTLALDVIREVGPGGHFMDQQHTLDHFRELWAPTISDKGTFHTWQEKGSKPIDKVAKEKVREILATHKPPPIPEDVDREVSKIYEKVKSELLKS